MAGEIYFPEFKFTEPKYTIEETEEISFKLIPMQKGLIDIANFEVKTINLNDFNDPFPDFELEEATPALHVKSLEEILPDFEKTLHTIGQDLGYPLTLDGRELLLVSRDELKPKTDEKAQKLVDRYGEYMRNGGNGDCTLLENGSYRLRVSLIEDEETGNKPILLEVAAHEYGHTLGKFLESAIFEELKAYTFASLFQRFYEGETQYSEKMDDLHPDQPHDVACHRLGELLRVGIPEGAILSHLVRKPLGRFKPTDYLNFI